MENNSRSGLQYCCERLNVKCRISCQITRSIELNTTNKRRVGQQIRTAGEHRRKRAHIPILIVRTVDHRKKNPSDGLKQVSSLEIRNKVNLYLSCLHQQTVSLLCSVFFPISSCYQNLNRRTDM